jgi:hypothetical protein
MILKIIGGFIEVEEADEKIKSLADIKKQLGKALTEDDKKRLNIRFADKTWIGTPESRPTMPI